MSLERIFPTKSLPAMLQHEYLGLESCRLASIGGAESRCLLSGDMGDESRFALALVFDFVGPGPIRTGDLLLRRQPLYPSELLGRVKPRGRTAIVNTVAADRGAARPRRGLSTNVVESALRCQRAFKIREPRLDLGVYAGVSESESRSSGGTTGAASHDCRVGPARGVGLADDIPAGIGAARDDYPSVAS